MAAGAALAAPRMQVGSAASVHICAIWMTIFRLTMGLSLAQSSASAVSSLRGNKVRAAAMKSVEIQPGPARLQDADRPADVVPTGWLRDRMYLDVVR
jgi:hypothetical protein